MIDESVPNQKLLAAPKKQEIKICAWCQGINNLGFQEFSGGVDPRILKELRVVDFRVRSRSKKNDVFFTHGICQLHTNQVFAKLGRTPPVRPGLPQSLITNHELRRQYMKGIFTEQDKQLAQQSQQQLKERFQKLANIVKEIKDHASPSCH